MGRYKLIESPEKFNEIWVEYKKYVKDNPRYSYSLSNKTGEVVAIPLEVPISVDGFEVWAKDKYSDIHHYFDNTDKRYNDYRAICTHIRKECRVDHITGGMVGQYNASITQRLNGLKEQTDVTSQNEKIGSITVTIVKPTE
jgi:hypothetical protein